MQFKYLSTSIIVCALATSCASPSEQIHDSWAQELHVRGFTPFQPPRAGTDVGDVMTIERNGREKLIAKKSTVFPMVSVPHPVAVAVLQTETSLQNQTGLAVDVAKALTGHVDVGAMTSATSSVQANQRMSGTTMVTLEVLVLKEAVARMNRDSAAYKEITKPGNFVLVSVLSADGVSYTFKGAQGQGLVLTVDLLDQLKVSPEVKRTSEGKAELNISTAMQLGYRFASFTEQPGLVDDNIDVKVFSPDEIAEFKRKLAR